MLRTCSLERAGSFGAPLRASPALTRANSLWDCPSCGGAGRSRLNNTSTTTFAQSLPCLPLRKKRATIQVAKAEPSSTALHAKEVDPFQAASTRLQSLLSGVGDGDAEMVDSMVSEESPESRLSMQVVLSAAITGVALTISMVLGNDPWGGASMSLNSVMSAGVGLTAILPLVILRAWTWTPQATEVMPALEDMHMQQLTIQAPWFCGSAPWHVMTMVALEVLPMTMLLLPAAQGGLMASVHFYTMALQSMGAPGGASVETLQLSCLALTAAGAALTKGLELAVSDNEFEVVQAAVDNSDRYYRLMSMDVTSRGGNATRAALAFRSVAGAWMEARNDASLAAMGLCALDVLAMGGLWYATGDLAAPAAAAMALNGVDAWHMHKAVTKREAQLSMSGGHGRGPSQPSA